MAKRRASRGGASASSRSRAGRKTARGGSRKASKSTRKAARPRSGQAASRRASARKGTRKVAARKGGAPKQAARKRAASKKARARKAPALNRPRRTVTDEDLVQQTPPSSLDMNRTASAARTGRREMKERRDQLTQTGPALTAGDVDADWESAYSVGDEAPGGDNPTPDQDIVDDIGRAVGVEYEDNEELKGADKVAKRDRHRWELDPASSEDYNDRD